eukprot:3941746-Rhodomonas_salina.1
MAHYCDTVGIDLVSSSRALSSSHRVCSCSAMCGTHTAYVARLHSAWCAVKCSRSVCSRRFSHPRVIAAL